MKKYTIVLFSFFLGLQVYSQQKTEKWTLKQCIDYAVEHNITVKQQELNVKSAEVDLNTSKNNRLPNLTAGIAEQFTFGRSQLTSSNGYQKGNSSGAAWQANSSTPLFTGFKIPNDIKSKEFSLKAATEGLNKVKDNMQINITSYYLDVLYKKELLKVYQEQARLTQKQVEKTEILYSAGKVPLSQIYDIKSQLASDELNITNSQNDLSNSLLALSQALNLSYYEYFDIEEPDVNRINVVPGALAASVHPDEVFQRAIEIKPHIKEALYNIESSKKDIKVALAGYWPTLSLGLNYQGGAQRVYNSENSSFNRQWHDNQSEYVLFSLSIPIFDRFETRNNVRKARINKMARELELDNVKLDMYKEIQQAYQNAIAAESKYSSTKKAQDAAAESFKYASERYQAGKISVFEYNESVTKLVTSQYEQVQSKYDYLFRYKILDFYKGVDISL